MLSIKKIDIPQFVRVRKYEVDIDRLCELLRTHKRLSNVTCGHIAKSLNIPKTNVEHWFRRDSSFSIPDPDIWMELKKILNITTCEFDAQVMEYEEKVGVYDTAERHYFASGISPTITTTSASDLKIIID